jgi:uncharacterized membrane protein
MGQGIDHHLVALKENAMFSIEDLKIETLLVLLVGVIFLITWIFVQVVFALYYACEFYSRIAEDSNSGFDFPNNPRPGYGDFIRFAFVIGMRIQAPRAQVTSQRMRRIVVLQCIISVIINTSILMLAILIVVRR